MGDVSAEPSMEDILSSIKRIIAEDGEGQPTRARRAPKAAAASFPRSVEMVDDEPEILELNEPAPEPDPEPMTAGDPIVSRDALASSRGSLDALTRMISRPEAAEAPADGAAKSMEAFVAELLRPMLREWLDANLPELVEQMVAKEIARITGNR